MIIKQEREEHSLSMCETYSASVSSPQSPHTEECSRSLIMAETDLLVPEHHQALPVNCQACSARVALASIPHRYEWPIMCVCVQLFIYIYNIHIQIYTWVYM